MLGRDLAAAAPERTGLKRSFSSAMVSGFNFVHAVGRSDFSLMKPRVFFGRLYRFLVPDEHISKSRRRSPIRNSRSPSSAKWENPRPFPLKNDRGIRLVDDVAQITLIAFENVSDVLFKIPARPVVAFVAQVTLA